MQNNKNGKIFEQINREDTQMANHRKRYSASLVIRKMQGNTMRYYYISFKINNKNQIKINLQANEQT